MASNAYKTFDRGTPAGRQLYNLYNKKNMDSTLDKDLLERLQKLRAERDRAEQLALKPKPVPKSRAHVDVPKPTGGRRSSSATQAFRMPAGGRKRHDTIAQERAHDVPAPAPAPKKGITDKDKARLQQIMEHGHALPDPATAPRAPVRRAPTDRDLKTMRFEECAQEIAERKEFLAALDPAMECAKTPAIKQQTEHRILGEIQLYVQEMKEIDAWLRNRPPSA